MSDFLSFFRKKRVFAMLIILFVAFIFYKTDWVGRMLYPVKYEEHILNSAQKYNTDPYLIASIIRVETNYKFDKTSKKGAIGLMQIMPDTADWIIEQGQFSDLTRDRLKNPEVNIEVGAWYLQSLAMQFDPYAKKGEESELNRIALTAAAYNAGPGNVSKWLNQGTWNGSYSDIEQIPFGETRHYIQRIVYYYKKYVQFYADGWQMRKSVGLAA